jgi:hypothetical protein
MAIFGPDLGMLGLQERQETVTLHLILAQKGLNMGLKLYMQAGVDAVNEEIRQLYERNVILPLDHRSLSPSDKQWVLDFCMFLKEMRDKTMKGRGYADEKKQRAYTSKGRGKLLNSISRVHDAIMCA